MPFPPPCCGEAMIEVTDCSGMQVLVCVECERVLELVPAKEWVAALPSGRPSPPPPTTVPGAGRRVDG